MNQNLFQSGELIQRFGQEAKLDTVFKGIENELKKTGQVVCQFKINGMALDESDEARLSQASLSEVETLEVLSQKPSEILDGILLNWCERIPQMITKNDQLATDIRFKGMEGQLKILVSLIDDCQLLVDSLMSIDQVFPQLPMVKSESWSKAQRQMAASIGEALNAFQKKDFTQLADILEYDMGHSLQVWVELITQLKSQAGDTRVRESAGVDITGAES